MADGVIGRLARILHRESDAEVGIDRHGIDHSERIVRLLIAELREPGDARIMSRQGARDWKALIDFILSEPSEWTPVDKFETFRVPPEIWRAMYMGRTFDPGNAPERMVPRPDCQEYPPLLSVSEPENTDVAEKIWRAWQRGRTDHSAVAISPNRTQRQWVVHGCGCILLEHMGPCRSCGIFPGETPGQKEVTK